MEKPDFLLEEIEENRRSPSDWSAWKRILLIAIATAFMGELKLNPQTVGMAQEFGLGIVAFSFALLFWNDLSFFLTGFVVGTAIVIVKAVFMPMSDIQTLLDLALRLNWPILAYYLTNAFVQTGADLRKNIDKPAYVTTWLFLADLLATFVEMVARGEQEALALGFPTFRQMVYSAAFRTAITMAFFYIVRRRQIVELAEHEKAKYEGLLMLLNGLHAEAFFLKKSAADIETTMAKAYALYRTLQNKQKEYERGDTLTLEALDVAKDIHEIKKDYQRIVSGIEKLMTSEDLGPNMSLEEIVRIIFSTNDSYARRMGKEIVFSSQLNYHFTTEEYHSIISVLNNLVSNAVEASEISPGHIQISSQLIGWHIFITVTDDGPGIDELDQELIFAPGFTTKFSGDGMQSTGIGLTHVQSLIKSMGGEVTLESKKGLTIFKLMIPRDAMEIMLNAEQVEEQEKKRMEELERLKRLALPSDGGFQSFVKSQPKNGVDKTADTLNSNDESIGELLNL